MGKTKRRRIKEGSTAASRSALSQCPCLCLKPLALPPSLRRPFLLPIFLLGGREGGCSLSPSSSSSELSSRKEGGKAAGRSSGRMEWLAAGHRRAEAVFGRSGGRGEGQLSSDHSNCFLLFQVRGEFEAKKRGQEGTKDGAVALFDPLLPWASLAFVLS